VARRDPRLFEKVKVAVSKLAEDPFDPTLHTHRLKGDLAGAWACTVDYDNRIIFDLARNSDSGEKEVFLITMGTHDEVY